MTSQYQMSYPLAQHTMGGSHLHTPSSIFQHMMGQQDVPHRPGSWFQMPQVPSISIPWSTSNVQQPELIRFTGEKPQTLCSATLHQKRKLEDPGLEIRKPKQFISEEKMAAHFQNMHISVNYQSDNAVPSTSSASLDLYSQSDISSTDLDMEGASTLDVEKDKSEHPRLVISEELKHLQKDLFTPLSLLSKLEKPSMALVLWEPPTKHLRVLPTPRDTPTPVPRISDDNNNNNNESIPDLNQTQPSNEEIVLEPMDL